MENGLRTDRHGANVCLGGGLTCAVTVAVCVSLAIGMGCDPGEGTPSGKERYAVLSERAMGYYTAILSNGESPVFRGNALAIIAELSKQALDADSQPMVVSAAIGSVGRDPSHGNSGDTIPIFHNSLRHKDLQDAAGRRGARVSPGFRFPVFRSRFPAFGSYPQRHMHMRPCKSRQIRVKIDQKGDVFRQKAIKKARVSSCPS